MSLNSADIPAIAESIAGFYLRVLHQDQLVELPHRAWNQAEYLWSRWKSDSLQQLDFSPTPTRLLLESSVREMIEALQTWLATEPLIDPDNNTTLRQQIADELHSLMQEFGEVTWNPSSTTLSVTTPRIVLQEIDLGPFEIALNFSRMAVPPAYEVLPLAPEFGGGGIEYPHPHVKGTRLCEGAGSEILRAALQGGRLSEFFLIIRQILQTYNDESAYLSLDDWWLESCHACGASIDPDDLSRCSSCSAPLCSQCGYCCEQCQTLLCPDCDDRCSVCDRVCCSNCAETCSACQQAHICQECLDDQSHCPHCQTSQDGKDSATDADVEASIESEEQPLPSLPPEVAELAHPATSATPLDP